MAKMGKSVGYRHDKPYRSRSNLVAIELLLAGQTQGRDISKRMGWTDGGVSTLTTLGAGGFCRLARREGKGRWFEITEKGRNLAREWGVSVGVGCCETAVFGEEGEHDDTCPQA